MTIARSLRALGLGLALAGAVLPRAGGSHAEAADAAAAGFPAYVQLLAARARAEGVRESTIQALTSDLAFNPRVIALDRAQPGASTRSTTPDFAPYFRQHVDPGRIALGRAKYRELAPLFPAIEARYGVPAPILLSIWGNETAFGKVRGDFDLARSLATLAYEGRRRELFASEFVALAKMADAGVPRSRLVGSWAGAFGNPQFLPSAYLRLAQDGDGDGVKDIWTNPADTLASIGNFFRDAGWRRGQPWGARAQVPSGFDRSAITSGLSAPSCPRVYARQSRWLTVREWRARGVQPLQPLGDAVLAVLIEPDGPGKSAFLLTGNYRVILHYNCSNYYALSVGLLADEIARSP